MNVILKLRPTDPDDEPFLRALQAQIDTERLGIQYWGPTQDEMAKKIVEMQFRAHSAHYKEVKNNWETKDNIIEVNDEAAGRFIVSGGRSEIRLCDIAIDKKFRGIAIGTAILDLTKNECIQSKRPLRLHVDRLNSACMFYLNQGFRIIEKTETHYFMEWSPNVESRKIYSFAH